MITILSSAGSSVKSSSGRRSRRRRIFGWRGPRGGSLSPQGGSMASYNGVLKDYSHSSLNEAFKSQNNVNFKLIKTGELNQKPIYFQLLSHSDTWEYTCRVPDFHTWHARQVAQKSDKQRALVAPWKGKRKAIYVAAFYLISFRSRFYGLLISIADCLCRFVRLRHKSVQAEALQPAKPRKFAIPTMSMFTQRTTSPDTAATFRHNFDFELRRCRRKLSQRMAPLALANIRVSSSSV